MPFRQGVKQALKKAEEDLKQAGDDIKAFLKGTGSTRPTPPSESLPHAGSFVAHEQAGSLGPDLLGTPSLAARLDDTSEVGRHLEQPAQPSSPMKEHRSSVIESSIHEPAVSQLEASEHPTVNTVVNNDELKFTPAERSASGQTSHEQLGEVSTGALKKLAAGAVGQVVDTLKIGPLRDVTDLLRDFADMYKMDGAVKTEYEALQHRLQALLKVLETHGQSGASASSIMVSKVAGIREFIEAELSSLAKPPSNRQYGRFLMAKEEEDRFVGCCRRIQEYMDRLSVDKLDTSLTTWRLEEEITKDRMSSWVRLLPSSPSAWYNSSAGRELKRRQCTAGTRVDVLANLLAWTSNSSTDAVYWLNGMAGTGKTTIAYSVCTELADKHKLAASFFCSRLREECRDVNRIIPSIAYQLAQFSAPFRLALSAVVEKDQDAHHKVLSEQFETLIRRPLLATLATRSLPAERMVVVIDALDECENKDSARDILDVLLSKSGDLAIKFVVSSRPEPQIRDQMNDDRVKSKLVLHELDTGDVHTDIKTYVREELKPMDPPPTESQIQALVVKAGILFIYAATVVRYVGYDNFQSDPHDRLHVILAGSESQEDGEHDEIDQLYITVLEAALGNRLLRKVERDSMRQVLHTVICARDPLTVPALSELLQIHSTERVRAVLRPLWSVLHVIGESELVTTLHASFPDFMFNPARSKTYGCDSDTHNRKLAEHCLELIKRTQPQFNICGLESSYLPDHMVPNIHERVANAISSHLLYACRYWSDHVEAGKYALTLAVQLQGFLSRRLLLWMEVLNLKKQMGTGVECMKLIAGWCSRFDSDEELVELANDARRFVDTFASNPVSQSTPHIYISMLTFWPRSGPIAKHYMPFTHGPVEAEGTALDQRQLSYLATWRFPGPISSISMSQDGRYIALKVLDDVLVIDSSSGQIRVLLHPISDYSANISTIMFSPDQTRVFAGSFGFDSETATIIGWDTRTGDIVVGPLQLVGHGSILGFTFSPDCTCIATCTNNMLVRLWDAESGKMLRCLETLNSVKVVAFSPDGALIAAGLSLALRVWNSRTGNTTLGPLSTPAIDMIAFSPDSSRIIHAERLYATEVHVRDAQSGQLIHELNVRKKDYIHSIGYSPDGRHIVSGHFRTINVWDAQNGKSKLRPLEGHTGLISAFAFSPDGSRIISACSDGLICTWDARQRKSEFSSISTAASGILLVNFSQDGQHFVSSSEDDTLHIWDSHTGVMTVGPIKTHTDKILGVNFLNDCVVSGSIDGTVAECDAMSGEVVRSLTITAEQRVRCIAFSLDGNLIATGSELNPSVEVNLWDARTGTRLLGPLTDIPFGISSVQLSPDGSRIVAGTWNPHNYIVAWDAFDGKNLFGFLKDHTGHIASISYSPDSALFASGSGDSTIIVWDAYTGSKYLDPLVGHSHSVDSVHFSPDSTRLVSGSNDKTIRIWDVRTGEMIFELLHGHEQAIRSVAYSPDGTRILSLSDNSVRIHDAQSTEER
ncbi:putative vegetative incompatibility protein HET-E-1, partial [Rhizoctonia solani 123E]